MTSPGDRAALARVPEPAPGQPSGYSSGPVWMRMLPPLVMLAMGLWNTTGASYWRDEAAGLTAVRRPVGQLMRMAGNVDGVHVLYYLLMWPLVRLAGTGEFVTRLPSVLSMALAAGVIAALGRRLVSAVAELRAGLIFAVLPQISRYAQETRSYAMVVALAATASYLLVRAIGTTGRRRSWLAGYAVCMGVMGALDVFTLLLAAAHAVTVALAVLRQDGAGRLSLAAVRGEGGRGGRRRGGGPGAPVAGSGLASGGSRRVRAGKPGTRPGVRAAPRAGLDQGSRAPYSYRHVPAGGPVRHGRGRLPDRGVRAGRQRPVRAGRIAGGLATGAVRAMPPLAGPAAGRPDRRVVLLACLHASLCALLPAGAGAAGGRGAGRARAGGRRPAGQ